ncbi:MAG: hypothetical protein Q9226_009309 [Calogaya cf. arnoldii]
MVITFLPILIVLVQASISLPSTLTTSVATADTFVASENQSYDEIVVYDNRTTYTQGPIATAPTPGGCSANVEFVTLDSAYTFTATAAENLTDPRLSAAASSGYVYFLGFETCPVDYQWMSSTVAAQATMPGNITTSKTSANLTRTGMLNTTSTAAFPTSSPTSRAIPRRTRIALGVGLSLGSLLICLGLALSIIRYRKNKRKLLHSSNDESPTPPMGENQPPYLQQKGELDAQGNSKFELGAEQRQYELEGETEVYEMPTVANTGEPSGRGLIELRGAEHSSELRA